VGTTPVYDLPYPEPTDRARNGSVAMRALAERVEELLTPAYATSLAADAPTQSGVGAVTVATFGAIVAGTSQFSLEGGTTIRYTGPSRWFMCDFEAYAVAGSAALAEVTAGLVIYGSILVASDSFSGSGAAGRIRVSTPLRLDNGMPLQLSIAGSGGGAVFDDKQFRIASIGAPE
jgi:hypothetical protein